MTAEAANANTMQIKPRYCHKKQGEIMENRTHKDITEQFSFWKNDMFFNRKIRDELVSLEKAKAWEEITERFCSELSFGTGGIRGIMGAGTNRMNEYTVARITAGLGEYLIAAYGEKAKISGVVIAYDSRNNSRAFAETAANVLSGNGIKVFMYKMLCPTPQLSFSVRYREAIAGIVITASHNPKEYNGYKVYDQKGCQLVPEQAAKVKQYIDKIYDYRSIDLNGYTSLIEEIDDTAAYVDCVLKHRKSDKCKTTANDSNSLKIVYTPLNGAGRVPMLRTLAGAGFDKITVVTEQTEPDGDFPTVEYPNPEDHKTFDIAMKYAEEEDADIVLATDPDSDRIGACVKHNGSYTFLSGNQAGALLIDFLLKHTNLKAYKKPAVVKTVVTSELGAEIAKKNGVSVFSTLTGFKYIGEKISQFEDAKIVGDEARSYEFLFGYEESCGYLAGTYARDKDAIVSGLLICEAAAELKQDGKTLVDRLNEIYEEYGYYYDALDSFTFYGTDGAEKIQKMMSSLRASRMPFEDTKEAIDYLEDVYAEDGFGLLPKENAVKYILQDGSWVAVRPSGTEPKLKIYYSIRANDSKPAESRYMLVSKILKDKLEIKE